MKLIKSIVIAALVAVLSTAIADDSVTVTGTKPAASATVTLTTADLTPADLGDTYSIGALNSSSYTYGPNFLIRVTYGNVNSSISIAISGSQSDYALAYRHTPTGGLATTTSDVPFGSIGTVSISGSATDTYVAGADTTAFTGFSALSTAATVFAIGAQSTEAAAVDLSTTINITATVE